MMCAIEAGRRGRSVCVIEHGKAPGEKIRISGGGRCNFTNLHTGPGNFLSANPHFAKSALKRYTQRDFIGWVDRHGIAWREPRMELPPVARSLIATLARLSRVLTRLLLSRVLSREDNDWLAMTCRPACLLCCCNGIADCLRPPPNDRLSGAIKELFRREPPGSERAGMLSERGPSSGSMSRVMPKPSESLRPIWLNEPIMVVLRAVRCRCD